MAENVRVTNQRIADLLIGAFEGGSNYWIDHVEYLGESEETAAAMCERLSLQPDTLRYARIPLAGGTLAVKIVQTEGEPDVCLDLDAIHKGLVVMAKKYPTHFADFQGENDDADTSDVFLQCCVFGEVIYG